MKYKKLEKETEFVGKGKIKFNYSLFIICFKENTDFQNIGKGYKIC